MNDYQTFPGLKQASSSTPLHHHLEQLERNGYFIVPDVLSATELAACRSKIDAIWEKQLARHGELLLTKVGDFGVVRAMMAEDPFFYSLITHPEILKYVAATVGETAILHLQNGVVLHPTRRHNQARYHKDFAKDFLSTKLLSFNALIAVDEFSTQTGGTWFVPGSHRFAEMPSDRFIEENQIQLNASAGSIIFFDSHLWHRGGENRSGKVRRAINQQYTRPFIKQQLDYPAFLQGQIPMDSKLAQVMGMWSIPPKGESEYRVSDPKLRTYRAGQG